MHEPTLPFWYLYPCPMNLPVKDLALAIVIHLYDL